MVRGPYYESPTSARRADVNFTADPAAVFSRPPVSSLVSIHMFEVVMPRHQCAAPSRQGDDP